MNTTSIHTSQKIGVSASSFSFVDFSAWGNVYFLASVYIFCAFFSAYIFCPIMFSLLSSSLLLFHMPVCILMRDRKKEHGFGWVGE